MGEVADALNRASPPRDTPRAKQHHGAKFEGDHSPSSRPPTPEPMLDSQRLKEQVEAESTSNERPVHRLMGDENDRWRPARICLTDPQGHFAQQYRRLALRLRDLANSRQARSIVITSAQVGDGKTTTACNLAIALAMTDHNCRVVLVDLDLHRASIAVALGIQVETPIDAVLRGDFTLEQAIMETDVDGLFIVAASGPAPEPDQLLAHRTLAAMISKLESRFDWVIIDTPPILASSDAQVILQHAATALLVVQARVAAVRALHKALDHLPTEKILASFLNSSRTTSQYSGYYEDYDRDSDEVEPATSIDPEEKDEFDAEPS